jgi:hypothetical protein
MVKMGNAYTILFGTAEGKKPFGRSGCRWYENIKHVRM